MPPAASRAGLSGLAVGVIAAGGIVAYAGITGRPIVDTLRTLLAGGLPPPAVGKGFSQSQHEVSEGLGHAQTVSEGLGQAREQPSAVPVVPLAGSGGTGAAVAASAAKYLGVPYRFGGADPSGFDCSGLVTWVLHHDNGIELPSNSHTITSVFYVWSGATTIPRSACQAGDLVCWPGHIAIATGPNDMIAAPHAGTVVQRQRIYSTPPPIIRRPKAYAGVMTV